LVPDEEDDLATFNTLYRAWCHNPISALCLCLLGGAYGLAGRLVELLGEVDVTVELLVDADRLVRLLESPAFLHVRVQLLRSGSDFEPDLLKSLYGLLMLLPQKSEAFKILDARLGAISSMHMALAGGSGDTRWSAVTGGGQAPALADTSKLGSMRDAVESLERLYNGLLDDFSRVQNLHARAAINKTAEGSLLRSL